MTTRRFTITRAVAGVLLATGFLAACQEGAGARGGSGRSRGPADPAAAARATLIARGKSLELPTPYEPVPGRRAVASRLGLRQDDVLGRVHHRARPRLSPPSTSATSRRRTTSARSSASRSSTAARSGERHGAQRRDRAPRSTPASQGCVTLPEGRRARRSRRSRVAPNLPPAGHRPGRWAIVCRTTPLPAELDAAKTRAAVDAALRSAEAETTGVRRHLEGPDHRRALRRRHHHDDAARELVDGQERDRDAHGRAHPAGRLHARSAGADPRVAGAPDDPRAEIRIVDILRMSSGLRISAPQDPDYDPAGPTPITSTSTRAASTRSSTPRRGRSSGRPNTVGRYRNTDPGPDQLPDTARRSRSAARTTSSFPQRALFDKIGIRTMVMETDPFGNFLTPGLRARVGRATGRGSATSTCRTASWNGERILPEGFVEVRQHARAGVGGRRAPVYGGFFWINGDGAYPVPQEALLRCAAPAARARSIIPSHDLVVVRIGHFRGSRHVRASFRKALEILMASVPQASGKATTGN